MKCIWRIILAVISLGVSEILKHKSHDKSLPCPLSYDTINFVDITDLVPGDRFVHAGYHYQLLDTTDDILAFNIDLKEDTVFNYRGKVYKF